ncbi:hypothetical protein DV096_15955 [Bradymonadaceae bacterium TMQ3]|uniref:Lipoprotein n=1 Tax=Lujinxingia sediminis TaxID=2480984 RepID=A0ABY0CQV9_9DELT|nr:hypothetical protein [Lujinxingia sediminis]RDV37005.1 hypothetical protein DV096_15955 [Bradymonadaceae bacterium TMQ3]RVU42915.1 hypothetical protein EA187_13845 [Lujinxingia sediminis]TXC73128.1 hypothetical protein FRC91_16895 [Bradymonadales bacterium TMQ1]
MKTPIKVLSASALLAMSLSGCVEQDATLQLKGGVLATTGEGENACVMPSDYDSVVVFSSSGFIAGQELRDFGQPLVGDEYVPGTRNAFQLGVAFLNRLPDSRNVGATGGGGSGGFEGLYLDQNAITVTGARVNVPADLNKFAGFGSVDFPEARRDFSALVESGGGSVVMRVPLIEGSTELDVLNDFVLSTAANQITFVFTVQLVGETLSGNEVTSNIYQYPVTICPSCNVGTSGVCAVAE